MKSIKAGLALLMGLVLVSVSGFVGVVAAADTDGDGLQDLYEQTWNAPPACPLNWLIPDSNFNGLNDGFEDYDADGATNIAEELPYATQPCNPDTDGDGLLDGIEILYAASGLTDFHPMMLDADADGVGDQNEDPDSDAALALAEQAAGGTSDTNWDSDYDGCLDPRDAAPLVNPNGGPGDLDGDGLPVAYENANGFFQSLPLGAHGQTGDIDADGFTNMLEMWYGTNPNVADADGDADGMMDAWEGLMGLNPLMNDAALDLDGDGLTNLAEFLQVTPANAWTADGDLDGMATPYENAVGTNPAVADGGADPDADVLTNTLEWQGGSHPLIYTTDFDADWMCDAWELLNGLNRFVDDRNLDVDGDGFINWVEYLQGYNPVVPNADLDADGLADAWENLHFGGLGQPAAGNPDCDGPVPCPAGWTNIQEFQTSSHPASPDADADADGLPDSWEAKYSPNTGNLLPFADTDGDGRINTIEFLAGTNPADATN